MQIPTMTPSTELKKMKAPEVRVNPPATLNPCVATRMYNKHPSAKEAWVPWEIWMRQSVNAKKKAGTIGIFSGKGRRTRFLSQPGTGMASESLRALGAELCVGPPKVTDSLDRRFCCDDSERKCESSKKY